MATRYSFPASSSDWWREENRLFDAGFGYIAGVDEAGRGPLAGPVVAAAVMAPAPVHLEGVRDSKQLTAAARRELSRILLNHDALVVGIGRSEPDEIDRLNILQASLLAMHRAVDALSRNPDMCLVDGNRQIPGLECPQETLVKGDQRSFLVAAASIIAKVERDAYMDSCHRRWPQFGFDRHKGYPTRHHLAVLQKSGICEIHRRSFEPVREVLKHES